MNAAVRRGRRDGPLRVAVFMPIASPWAREAAVNLARSGRCEVHVLDFALTAPGSYLTAEDPCQRDDIRALAGDVASVDTIGAMPASGLRYLLAAPLLAARLRGLDADVLLVLYAGGSALMAMLSGFRPYVVFTMGSDVLLLEGALKRGLSRRALLSARLVLAHGAHLAERTRELAPGVRVEPFYHGIDTDYFRPAEARPPGPVTLACTRGFSEVYNNALIVEALAEMRTDDLPAFAVDFTAPGAELPRVRALADRILAPDLRARVTFRGGVGRAGMRDALQRSDVFVSASRSDGTPTSLLEALACGLYPVLSDIPANREWVGPGAGEGALFPVDDAAALARALERAVRDGEARRRAADVNLERVRRLAHGPRNMRRLAGLLAEVGGRPAAPADAEGTARVG